MKFNERPPFSNEQSSPSRQTASPIVSQPLVGIGVPVYNGGSMLVACLDAVVAQTYDNLDIVISDNASTDETRSICERYASRDSRIRFFPATENRGAAWNHRYVLERARGEYFKWCAADDTMAPEFVERCVAALEARPDVVLAFPLTIVIDETGQPVRRTDARLPLTSPQARIRFDALLSPWDVTHSPFYGVMRRSGVDRVRPFGPFLAGDRSFLAELALAGPFFQVEEFLMYRRHYSKHWKRSSKDEQALLNPTAQLDYHPREFVMLREHVSGAIRAEASVAARLGYLLTIGRWVFRNRAAFVREARDYIRYVLRRAMGRQSTRS